MAPAPSDPDLARSIEPSPVVLVARIAESLPQLNGHELNELADAVEALTEAIGLRIDWSDDTAS